MNPKDALKVMFKMAYQHKRQLEKKKMEADALEGKASTQPTKSLTFLESRQLRILYK